MTFPVALGSPCRLQQRGDVLAEDLDGETVLLDERTGAVHVLNTSAALVWKGCDRPAELGELARSLAAALDADPATVERDVLALGRKLLAVGLVQLCDHPGRQRPVDA